MLLAEGLELGLLCSSLLCSSLQVGLGVPLGDGGLAFGALGVLGLGGLAFGALGVLGLAGLASCGLWHVCTSVLVQLGTINFENKINLALRNFLNELNDFEIRNQE